MGHLIHPVAYRLGFFSNWHDTWISTNNIAYTELLHNTFMIRNILRFFFDQICSKTSPELIFSHYSLQYMSNDSLNLKVFFYDSALERKYQSLYRICKRLNRNQKRLFKTTFKFFKLYTMSMQTKSIKLRKLLYRWFYDRGFVEYLQLRRLIFFFLLILVREKNFSPLELLRIRLIIIFFLEYFWRKVLILKCDLNVFDFFFNFFAQFDNLLKQTEDFSMDMCKTLAFNLGKSHQLSRLNLLKLSSWFSFNSLFLLSKKVDGIRSFFDELVWFQTVEANLSQTDLEWKESVEFDMVIKNLNNVTPLLSLLIKQQKSSLLIWTFLKMSHTLWHSKRNMLNTFINLKFFKYRTMYKHIRKPLTANNIWTLDVFLDFYRLYMVCTRYQNLFENFTNIIMPVINRISFFPVSFSFFGFDNDLVTAEFVALYLAKKFEQRFKIKELFGPISKDLRRIMGRTPLLLGYKLQFVGRLTRRDRLRTSWVMAGKVPVSTMSARVEHGCSFGVLRNGVCSIRVWLYRPKFFGNNRLTYLYKVRL